MIFLYHFVPFCTAGWRGKSEEDRPRRSVPLVKVAHLCARVNGWRR